MNILNDKKKRNPLRRILLSFSIIEYIIHSRKKKIMTQIEKKIKSDFNLYFLILVLKILHEKIKIKHIFYLIFVTRANRDFFLN